MKTYNGYYKCRLCQKIHLGVIFNDEDSALDSLAEFLHGQNRYYFPPLYFQHNCGGGNIGISDFVGLVYEDKVDVE